MYHVKKRISYLNQAQENVTALNPHVLKKKQKWAWS